ncbi:MAG: 2-oxoglutarate dehydrogenase complex dihydrolipoyllysine-residue succinyltransferase [Pseudobdellovibrionaceae bacterium]|jgi:2-oxoglutarate dehydrogenase E2 component (dihydrolipoamide succinyltransferase)|nr:2-oxoglutarate dehydrogenase complex dihydrolipoyllysine-residue succinyltransferase [Pseudobdellovibrionaceae bacterium]
MTKILVPTLGESVTEAIVSKWLKQEGEAVAQDEPICELETDKVTLEVNAPASGVIAKISFGEGKTVEVGAVLGEISEGGVATPKKESAPPAPAASAPAPAAAAEKLSPAVQKITADNKINPADVAGTGKDGRVTKGDVIAHMEAPKAVPAAAPKPAAPVVARAAGPREEKVKMTRLRQKIAERLKEAQNTAAMLTTFNEVDMTAVMDMRNAYKDSFEKKHGVKLGFMSFFVKAAVNALREIPAVNAEISGDEIIYKNYYDISVAVSTPQGLVVPVVKDCDAKSMAQIEKDIASLGSRARDGKITVDEMSGGTFTITNGGVFGSLMSTPIINPPQVAILGMHKTMMRPMVMPNGDIKARPMMYLALSYDHRLIDGREAVTFLVRIKEALEDPQRLILEV